jgi:hypothetical protein
MSLIQVSVKAGQNPTPNIKEETVMLLEAKLSGDTLFVIR